ncbi:integrase [Leuconostoc fallax]|uniref:Tyr recombinase domain-containing protein n=1 Tax=Leuconostoc fallax TaxID=1251 RepID=A0A4R5N8M6_9LACO|nr:integrase [Leuconostoc fallax]MBU7455464.1 hypothetical protein [Leuconostoc fallax]TDG68289.1 hypothetical protein C5L23_000595 [Leuconostoc fallax]
MTIKSALKDAYIDGYIDRDIFGRVKAVSAKREIHIQNYLNATDFEKLQNYLYSEINKFDKFHLLILLAIETGARLGELLALNPSDFDLRAGG